MKAIKNNDVIDVIYDSWYGLPLDKADKVVYDYTHGKLIPIEWIEQYQNKHQLYGVCDDDYVILDNMLCAWEAENEI